MQLLLNSDSPQSEIEISQQLQLSNSDSPQSEGIEEINWQLQLASKVQIKRCSKCGVFSKLYQSIPPKRLDAWCDDCFVNTPAIERTRKTSVGEHWKLIQKQEKEAQERAELVAQLQAQKELLAEKRAKERKNAPKKSKKKTVEGAYLLALDFGELSVDVEEDEARDAILAHDARRAYIARAQDRTIFDEDYYGERNDD